MADSTKPEKLTEELETEKRANRKLINKKYYEKIKKAKELMKTSTTEPTIIKPAISDLDTFKSDIISEIKSLTYVAVPTDDKIVLTKEEFISLKRDLKKYKRLTNFYFLRSINFQRTITDVQRTKNLGAILSSIIPPIPEKNNYDVDYSNPEFSDESEDGK